MVTSYGLGREPCTWAVTLPLTDVDGQHLAVARIGAAAAQAGADVEALQHGDPALGPPALAERAALRLRLDAALAPRGRDAETWKASLDTTCTSNLPIASCRRANRSFNWSLDSSVSQASPVPTTATPTSCLRSIISSIFSSSVPTQTNLCTCTLRVWPMRKARSVAWFSTAGFHQRSKWKTWLGGRQVQPVPPALSDSRNSRRALPARPGSARPCRSRCLAGTPPCRNSTSRPNVSCRWRLKQIAHLGELREDQGAVAGLRALPPASPSAAPACRSGPAAASCRPGTAPDGCRPA